MAPLEDLSRRQLVERDFRFESYKPEGISWTKVMEEWIRSFDRKRALQVSRKWFVEVYNRRCQPVDRIRRRGFQLSFR
ncbi:MAG: hypothetical protein ACTS80_01795 [Candidatus Hodgkinia cicadicola]